MKVNQKNRESNVMTVDNEIEQTLSQGEIGFEEIPGEETSPLNQPVVEKSFSDDPSATARHKNTESVDQTTADGEEEDFHDEPFDAPEQDIHAMASNSLGDESIEIPLAHAQMAADTFLGIADNAFEVGTGFFITIKKHEDFYEFDEVIEVIEEQNAKNIKRLKLDDEDKALLRPLIIVIIRKKSKTLTPEQQLAAAALSILIKKAKIAVEIRNENNILVERIRDIIKEEMALKASEQNKKGNTVSDNAMPSQEFSEVIETAE